MEDRDISITTCMYVGESSKSRREGSFPPCEFRLTLTVPRPYPFPQLEKGFRFDKSCKSCTICASETKERRRSFPGSKLSANSCYPPRNKILLSRRKAIFNLHIARGEGLICGGEKVGSVTVRVIEARFRVLVAV